MTANYVSVGSGNILADPQDTPLKWSTDGINWNKSDNNIIANFDNGESQIMLGVAYNPVNNLWVSCGYGNIITDHPSVVWSDDGKSWNKGSGEFYPFSHISALACNPVDNLWVACGRGNTLTGHSPLLWSKDGKKWNKSDTTNFASIPVVRGLEQIMSGAAYNPVDNLWVACGLGNSLAGQSPLLWSKDGKKWNNCNLPGKPLIKAGVEWVDSVAHSAANNLWVANVTGNTETGIVPLIWSSDGKNWNNSSGDFGILGSSSTTRISSILLGICTRSVAYSPDDDLWVATGFVEATIDAAPYSMWSTDGKKWEKGNLGYGGFGSISYSPINNLWTIGTFFTPLVIPIPVQSKDGKIWEPNTRMGNTLGVANKPGLVYPGRSIYG